METTNELSYSNARRENDRKIIFELQNKVDQLTHELQVVKEDNQRLRQCQAKDEMQEAQSNAGIERINLLGMIKAQKRYIQELENMLMVQNQNGLSNNDQ